MSTNTQVSYDDGVTNKNNMTNAIKKTDPESTVPRAEADNSASDPDQSNASSRSYHHGDLRQALLDAACAQLKIETADSLSLRALARQIGVSQTAPYRHFDSRNALFAGIATYGFTILAESLEATVAQIKGSAIDAMIELGLVYLQFSEEHAEKYRLLFDSSLVEFDEYPDLQEASARSFNALLALIRQGKREGVVEDRRDEELAARIWSGMHGIASLLQINRHRDGMKEKPVGRALFYLADDRRDAMTALLNTIKK